jgi:hypothetical protein
MPSDFFGRRFHGHHLSPSAIALQGLQHERWCMGAPRLHIVGPMQSATGMPFCVRILDVGEDAPHRGCYDLAGCAPRSRTYSASSLGGTLATTSVRSVVRRGGSVENSSIKDGYEELCSTLSKMGMGIKKSPHHSSRIFPLILVYTYKLAYFYIK